MGLIVNINWKYGVYLSVAKALCVGTQKRAYHVFNGKMVTYSTMTVPIKRNESQLDQSLKISEDEILFVSLTVQCLRLGEHIASNVFLLNFNSLHSLSEA